MPELIPVQLWMIPEPVALSDSQQQNWLNLLSAAEQQRRLQFVQKADQHRYLLTRVLCRTVLGQFLEQPPESLQFSADQYGKPRLSGGDSVLDFNVSHTDGLIVLAVSPAASCGVDAENTERTVDLLALARRYFAASEVAAIEALSVAAQREYFFACWTLKEAWLKGLGLGLRVPLDSFAFTLNNVQAEAETLILESDAALQEKTENWSFKRFSIGHHRVALALQCPADAEIDLQVFQQIPDELLE